MAAITEEEIDTLLALRGLRRVQEWYVEDAAAMGRIHAVHRCET